MPEKLLLMPSDGQPRRGAAVGGASRLRGICVCCCHLSFFECRLRMLLDERLDVFLGRQDGLLKLLFRNFFACR